MPRLDRILKDRGLSSSKARDALRHGKVFLNGVPTALGGREVDPAAVTLRPEAPRIQPGRDVAFLHSDPHLVVVWKPAGLLSVPAPRRGGHQSLLGVVGRAFGAALPVHRLDEQTSGVMLVARTARAQTALKRLFETHDIEREYRALVLGTPPRRPLRIDSVLVRDRGDGLRGSAPEGDAPADGRPATTWVRQVEVVGKGVSLVAARLETGRTHQVRIHLSEQGWPVLGDPLYASKGVRRRSPRLALHALRLAFRHPLTGQDLVFDTPLADDLEQLRMSMTRPGPAESPPTGARGRPRRGRRRS